LFDTWVAWCKGVKFYVDGLGLTNTQYTFYSVMIWDDPWCVFASSEGGTSLPPMKVVLEHHQRFDVSKENHQRFDVSNQRFDVSDKKSEFKACFYEHKQLVSSCVLHLYDTSSNVWILETFSAIKKHQGYGTMLLRCVMDWIYNYTGQRFILGYTWELTVLEFVGAWWKGWLKTAHTIEYGWAIDREEGAEETEEAEGAESNNTILSESGLNDGWGTVIQNQQSGVTNWNKLMESRGWNHLWMRSATRPPGSLGSKWRWTGEIVVVGLLNKPRGVDIDTHWITPDRSPNAS
jgi:hypothetical protein